MGKTFTDIVFVRHGETEGNLAGLLQGRGNSHLSENGKLQAQAAARELAEEPFTFACSSDLIRAVETAEIILEKHPGIPLEKTPALEEWDLGDFDGKPQAELMRDFPGMMDKFRLEKGDFPVPGGESRDEFQKRVSDYLSDVIRRNKGGTILLVAHGWTAHRIIQYFYGLPKENRILPTPQNTGISRFRWFHDPENCQMLTWNSTSHLKGLPLHQNPVD